jgi:hypothetical protein
MFEGNVMKRRHVLPATTARLARAMNVVLSATSLLLVVPSLFVASAAADPQVAVAPQLKTLVPAQFEVPQQATLAGLKLRKVDPALAEQDYPALMAARQQIRLDLGTEWPADNLTLAENKASLEQDLKAFNERRNFTYHLLDPSSERVIGCLYISQSGDAQYHAAVYYWVVPELHLHPTHPAIRAALQQWLHHSWPFAAIDYSLLGALPAEKT